MRLIGSKNLSILLAMSLVATGFFGLSQQARAIVAFNTFPISYTQQTNYDWPMIDARNASLGGSFSLNQTDHDNGVQAQAGDEIEFQIYYHNSGVPEDEATNVMVRAILPGSTRQDHEVSASIDSDQTNPIGSFDSFRGGNIAVHINGSPQTLEFISGSVKWFPNRSTTAQIPSNGNDLLSGSGLNIGTVLGCFEHSGFVIFRARVGNQVTENRDLSISKRVLNVTRGESTYQDSVTANSGDRVRFQLNFSTSGSASQSNVIVRDILPGRLTYVSGTELIDGASVGSEYDLFASGRNMGSQSSGQSHSITFEANVADASQFSGSTTLINTANVRSDQVSTRQDDAVVNVQLVQGIQFQKRKTAFNLTQGVDATSVAANPGDIITYTLYYKNTGQTPINAVVIEDDIRDVTELAEITNQGGAVSVNGSIRWVPVDVPAGVEVAKTFQVRIRATSLFPASSDLVMVNVYGNQVNVTVRKPAVAGVIRPPRTGPSDWLSASLAGLATLGYWLRRRKLKVESEKLKV